MYHEFNTTHELKTTQPYFEEVFKGNKRFELRKNDRGFNIGDTMILREWNEENKKYTGRKIRLEIRYILEDYPGLEKGYCILGV